MKKTWLICWHDFKRHVFRKRFLFAVLSMPLFVGVIGLVSFLSVWLQYNDKPVGYIDSTNILKTHEQVQKKPKDIFNPIELIKYVDESAAKSDLEQGKLQAYLVMPENYLDTGEVTMVTKGKIGINANDDINSFLRQNLLNGRDPQIVTRLNDGTPEACSRCRTTAASSSFRAITRSRTSIVRTAIIHLQVGHPEVRARQGGEFRPRAGERHVGEQRLQAEPEVLELDPRVLAHLDRDGPDRTRRVGRRARLGDAADRHHHLLGRRDDRDDLARRRRDAVAAAQHLAARQEQPGVAAVVQAHALPRHAPALPWQRERRGGGGVARRAAIELEHGQNRK